MILETSLKTEIDHIMSIELTAKPEFVRKASIFESCYTSREKRPRLCKANYQPLFLMLFQFVYIA